MNSQAILSAITTYRAANAGEIPAIIAIDTQTNSIACYTFAQLEASQDPEWKPVWINHTVLIDFYKDNIPVVIDAVNRTTVRDYLWMLLEYETRP